MPHRHLTPPRRQAKNLVWLAPVFLSIPFLFAQTQQPVPKTAVLLVDTDDTCHLIVDDQDKGIVTPSQSRKFTIGMGQHILKCTIENIPDLVWRKVLEVKDASQVVAAISLKALHIQYDQAVAKSKNQAAEADATAQNQLGEAEAEEKLRESAKAEVPQKFLQMVQGDWQGVQKGTGPLDPDLIVHIRFEGIEDGAISGYLTFDNRMKWKLAFAPELPNRLNGVGSEPCVATKDRRFMKPGTTIDEQGWGDCRSNGVVPNKDIIYLINNAVQFHMGSTVVTLTR